MGHLTGMSRGVRRFVWGEEALSSTLRYLTLIWELCLKFYSVWCIILYEYTELFDVPNTKT